jgi:hypothetical protein
MTNSKQMVQRQFWLAAIHSAWKQRPVLWLSGVRRVGKTVLCQSLPGIEYFDVTNLRSFRAEYPQGQNIVVAQDVKQPFQRLYGPIKVEFLGLAGLIKMLPSHFD